MSRTRKSAADFDLESFVLGDDGQVAAELAPAAPPSEAGDPVVVFVSREKEPVQFDLRRNRGVRLGDGRISWSFSPAEAELVRRHSHITTGRIVEQ